MARSFGGLDRELGMAVEALRAKKKEGPEQDSVLNNCKETSLYRVKGRTIAEKVCGKDQHPGGGEMGHRR